MCMYMYCGKSLWDLHMSPSNTPYCLVKGIHFSSIRIVNVCVTLRVLVHSIKMPAEGGEDIGKPFKPSAFAKGRIWSSRKQTQEVDFCMDHPTQEALQQRQ